MEQVSYYVDKKFLIFRLLASGFIVALCFIILVISQTNNPLLFASSPIKEILYPILSVISLTGILFFSLGVFHPLKLLLFRLPVLSIQDNGVVDNSAAINVSMIPFDSIKDAYTKPFLADKYICIQLNNEKDFLEKTFFLKRWFMVINKKMGFEYIVIQLSPGFSSKEIDDIAQAIRDHTDFYRTKRKILLKED